ncbi:Glutamine synthetase adenylyltransferase [uncultured Coleofasciculus sp.]|uniref:Glutamine synthetase adenylyltransferase n=1 Tax=uncultured Coleofasciculus sp. TaxID=1267456 RepID=A0A6J4I9Q2_9CYAN|nr:Glutamine synthetase adenylyltransferase [uncultured Coleofasciculus sp.]
MSNYLAIATVTAVLQRTLQAIVQVDVDGARVTTLRPDTVGSGTPEAGVNLYLYHVMPNPAWRNTDLRTRFSEGQFAKRPQAALDLYYILSCYGNEIELEPQRLLGSVVRTLHARPVITQETIRDTLSNSAFTFLADSNLAEQVETVKFMPVSMSAEELSNIWSVFFQTPHTLSIAYQAGVVLIESDDIPQRALPVRDRSKFAAMPFGFAPVVERVVSQVGTLEPIVADSTLIVRGTRLRGEITKIRLAGVEVTPQEVNDTYITFPLTAMPAQSLRAGVQGLQVVHFPRPSTQGNPIRVIDSNIAALVVRPTITNIRISDLEGQGNELRLAKVIVQVDLTITRTQRVVLLLNERSTNHPSAYTFESAPHPNQTKSITFAIYEVKAAEYLVRVQVDGAESLLTVDMDSESPTFEQYISPVVVIA